MSANPAIDMRGVSIGFPRGRSLKHNRFQALHEITLLLRHGEKLGLVGRNGAGKSTLLRVFADVLKPDTGVIQRSHGSCQLLSLGLGFLPHLSGRQNAILSGMLQGLEQREIEGRLDAVLQFSELGEFFDQPLDTYSSGMRSRLGFATALQLDPDILLLDEVLAVGDANFRQKSREAITQRLRSDVTVVLVAHDERLLREICDRVVWMEQGRIVMDGEPGPVLKAYADALKS